MAVMDREIIDNVVCEIMYQDGPDRHVDGHDKITDFIVAMTEGRGDEWARSYAKQNALRARTNRFI